MAKLESAACLEQSDNSIKIVRKYIGEKSAEDVLRELIQAHAEERQAYM